jgi:hypothetical protein
MAQKTYLEIVNDVLRELNEVTITTLTGTKNIQRFMKEAVNRAYFDIVNTEAKWPFLSVSETSTQYGGTEIDAVAGTQWYYLNTAGSSINGATTDYIGVDWNDFLLTTEGVSGESSPYTYNNLEFLTNEEWKDFYKTSDTRALSASEYRGEPRFVIRSPDNRRFGLSPVPDQAYKVYFQAFVQPTALSADADVLIFPDQYYSVLYARLRYYGWQFKEHPQQASMALQDYKLGIRRMKEQLIDSKPSVMSDDRVRFV